MHELSLIRTIFRTLEDALPEADLNRISVIRLKVGPLANAEPLLLQSAFEALIQQEETRFLNTQLDIQVIPILIQCTSCGAISEVVSYRFICASCTVPCANVVQGNELLIEQVEFAG